MISGVHEQITTGSRNKNQTKFATTISTTRVPNGNKQTTTRSDPYFVSTDSSVDASSRRKYQTFLKQLV